MTRRIAYPSKGRLRDGSFELLERLGFPVQETVGVSENGAFECFAVRAQDIPRYVQSGAVDFGITGLDLVLESQADVIQCAALPFGFCRLCVAAKAGVTLEDLQNATIATSFPRLATDFFSQKGIQVDVVELSGAVEKSVRLGVADAVVDLVQTGKTLKENGLMVVDDVLFSSAVFIANKKSGKPGWLYV